MSNTKHTPGPWYVKGSSIMARWEDGEEIQVALTSATSFCGTTDKVYAANRRIHQESEVNARLIAAAPELLEALYDMLGYLPAVQDYRCSFCGREYDEQVMTNCPSEDCSSFKAKAVIAKAEGKQTDPPTQAEKTRQNS